MSIDHCKQTLTEHPLYRRIDSKESLRIFMAHHVVCVWDFMTILEELRRRAMGQFRFWQPPESHDLLKFVLEVLKGEAADVDQLGQTMSHYEMYLRAMADLGVDQQPVIEFVHQINQADSNRDQVIDQSRLPDGAKEFVRATLNSLELPTPCLAAVFFHAREDIIPAIFRQFVERQSMTDGSYARLKYYLDRHIQVDSEEHGPMAQAMLKTFFHKDPKSQGVAIEASIGALRARIQLWNDIEALL